MTGSGGNDVLKLIVPARNALRIRSSGLDETIRALAAVGRNTKSAALLRCAWGQPVPRSHFPNRSDISIGVAGHKDGSDSLVLAKAQDVSGNGNGSPTLLSVTLTRHRPKEPWD